MAWNMRKKKVGISTMNLSNKALEAPLVASTVYQYLKSIDKDLTVVLSIAICNCL